MNPSVVYILRLTVATKVLVYLFPVLLLASLPVFSTMNIFWDTHKGIYINWIYQCQDQHQQMLGRISVVIKVIVFYKLANSFKLKT